MSRAVSIGIAVLLIVAVAFLIFWNYKNRTQPTSEQSASQHQESKIDQSNEAVHGSDAAVTSQTKTAMGWEWGGALNSASIDGSGFFDIDSNRAFNAKIDPPQSKYIVDLHSRSFLPQSGDAGLKQVFADEKSRQTKRTVYLQCNDHPTPLQRDQLSAQGIEIFGYVTGYAWLARGTEEAFRTALSFDFVRAIASIDPRDKLLPQIFAGAPPPYALSADGSVRFILVTTPGTDLESLRTAAAAVPALANAQIQAWTASSAGPRFAIGVAGKAAGDLAKLDVATWLEFAPPPVAARDATSDIESNIPDVRDSGPMLSGSGISVAVRELGKPDPHVDFASRLQYITSGNTSAADQIDHATAVCGQIGSNGVAQPAAKGIAPSVTMLAYGVQSSGSQTFSTADVVDAAGRGVRVSNHSYGPSGLTIWGDYEQISQDWDNAIRTNNLLGMFAGNEETGGLFKHIDYFVGAKNTICVAATSNAARAGDTNPVIAQSDGIASFTEHGPMNDGRVKPDLVAYGDTLTLDTGTNNINSSFSDPNVPHAGTSFSTPAVTGVAALVYQQYQTVVGSAPSAAVLKALLCNSATDLGSPGPDAIYGFGIVNAKTAVGTINLFTSASNSPFFEGSLNNGQSTSFTVSLQSVSQLKVTLVWMDVGGNPAATKALVNDLDLQVISPTSTVNFPYSLNPANPSAPATNTGPNTVDPIEQTIVNNPADGNWTIQVTGTNIPSGPQSFAVCVNVSRTPLPVTASILASPVEGPTPLTVAFSGTGSLGSITTYDWNYGDGNTDNGVTVTHTYTAPGTYIATLTVTDNGGKQSQASVIIKVDKRTPLTFPTQLQVHLNFPQKRADKFSLTMTARELVKTPQQTREALRDGTFEGKIFTLRINGNIAGTNAILDRKATFKSATEGFKISFPQGRIQMTLSKQDLAALFTPLGMTSDPSTSGTKSIPVQLETDDAIYSATYTVKYKATGKAGTAR